MRPAPPGKALFILLQVCISPARQNSKKLLHFAAAISWLIAKSLHSGKRYINHQHSDEDQRELVSLTPTVPGHRQFGVEPLVQPD